MLKKPPPSRQIKQVSSSPPTGQTASLLERIKSLNRYSDHQKPLTHVASFTTDRVKNRARSNFSEYFDTNKLFNNTLEPVRSNSSKKKHFYDEKIESDDKLWSLKIKGQEQKQELAVLNEQNQKLQRNLEQVQHQLGHTDGNDDVEILKKILAGYKKKAEERKSIMKQLYGILKTKDQELEFLRNNYEKQIKSTEQKMINLKQESEAQLINAEERVAYIENKLLSISAFRQQKLHDLLCKEDKMREILQRLIRKQESKEKIDEVKTILNFIAKEKSKFESPQKSNVHQSKQIDAIQNEYQKIAQNYEQMTIQIDKMNKTFSKYLPKEYPYSDSITILQVNVKEIIHKVEDYDRQVKELQLDIESQQTEFSRLQKQRDQYKKKDQDIIKLTQQVSDLQVQLSTLENQYNQCLLQQRLDDESNSELSALNDQLNIQVVKQQSQIQLLSQQIDEQQKLIFSNEQILQSQYNKELEMNEELKELKQQFQSKEHEQKNKILLMQLNNQKESLAEQIESLQEELENKRLKISEQEQVNKQLNQKINKLLTDFKSQQDDLKNKKIIFEDFKRLQEQNQQATVLLEEAESRIEDLSQMPPKIVESILNIIQSTFHKQKQVQKQKSKISQNFISDLNIKEFSKLQQELDIIDQQIQQSESKINQLEISKSDLQNKNLEYYKQIEALMKQLEYFESNSNEFEQLQQNQIQLETSNKSLKTKNDELQHSINQMHQQQKLSYQQSQDITIQHQQEKNLLIQERKNLQNRIIDLESQIELDKQELEEKESEISQLMNNSTIDQYQQNLIQQQAQCKELLMLIQQQDEKISEDHQTIRNLQQQIQQQNTQLSNELQQKNYQINLLEGQLKQQIQEIANLEVLIQHNENQRKEDDSNLKDIMSQSEKLMDEQKSNSGFLVDENNSLKEQLSQSTVQIIEIQQQIKVITTQHQQEMNKLLNKQNESGGEGFQSLNAQNTELLKQLEFKENERQIQQNQLIELKQELNHQQEINQELQSSIESSTSLKEQISQSKEQINHLQHQIEDITAQHSQEIHNEGDAFQSLNAQNTELLKQLEIKENERQIQQNQLIELKLELTNQQEINQELQSSIESSTITHNYNLNQIQELKQQISQLEEQESDIRQENDIAKRDLEDYDKKIKKLNENNQDIQQQLMEQKSSSAFLFDENNSLKEQLSQSKEQINDLQHQIEDITAQHQQEIQNEGDAFQSLKAQNTELLKQYEIKENERQIQQNQFIELTQELNHQQEINQELQSSIESSTSLKEQISQSKEQINHLQHQIEDITAQHQQEIHNEGDAFQSLNAQNTELLKQLEIKENERQIQQNQLIELKHELTNQQEINQELQSSIESSTITDNYNLNQIQELKQQIFQLEEQESDIRQENDIAKRDLEDYDKKIKKLNENNQDIQQQLMEQKSSSAFLFDENNSLKEQLSQSKEQINDLQHQIEEIIAQHQQEIHNEGDAIQSLKAQNTELLKQYEIKENERQIQQKQLIELKLELTHQQEINQELQSSIESSTITHNYNLNQIQELKQQISQLEEQESDIRQENDIAKRDLEDYDKKIKKLNENNQDIQQQLMEQKSSSAFLFDENNSLKEQLSQSKEQINDLQHQIEDITAQHQQEIQNEGDAFQSLKAQNTELLKQYEIKENERQIQQNQFIELTQELTHQQEINQKLQSSIESSTSLKEQLSQSKEQINHLQHQIEDITAQHSQEIHNEGDAFQSLNAQNTELLKQLEIKENERQIQQNQLIELKHELTNQQEINQELQSSIESSAITNNYNLNQIQELKQQISQLEEQESDIRQENDIAKRDLEDYDKKIKKLNENNQDIQQQLMEQKSSSAFLFDENNSLKAQLSQSKEQINHLQHQIEDITAQHSQEIHNEGDAFQSLNAQNTELLKQLEIKENERQIQQNQLIELKLELTNQQEINQELQSSIESSTITHNYNLNQIQELKQQISQLEEQESDIRQENDIAKRDLEDYDKKIKKLNENNQDIQQQLMEQKSSSAFLFDENNSLKEQLSKSKEQINDLQHQIEDITAQHQQEIQNEGDAFQSLKAQNTELLKQYEIKENERQIQQNQFIELTQELTHQQEINQELQSSIESSTSLKAQLSQSKEQINHLQHQIEDITAQHSQEIHNEGDAFQSLNAQNTELLKQLEIKENERQIQQNQLIELKLELTNQQEINQELQSSIESSTITHNYNLNQIQELKQQISQLEEQESDIRQENDIAKRDLEDYDKKIKKLNENNQDIQQQLMEQKSSSAFLFDENNSLKEQLSKSKEQINDLQHQIEDITAQHQQEIQNEGDAFQSLKAQNTELLKQYEIKENERQIQQNQFIELTQELTHQQEINQELQSSIESSTSLKEQLSQSKEQINHLQHQIEDITAQHSQEIHNEGDAFQSLNAQNTELLKQLEIKENERQIQQNQFIELKHELTNQQEINQELQSSIESSTITNNYNLNQIQELKIQINQLKIDQTTDYQQLIQKLKEQNQELQNNYEELSNQTTLYFEQIENEKQSQTQLLQENNELMQSANALTEINHQQQKQINDLQYEIDQLQETILNQETEITVIREQNQKLQLRSNQLQQSQQSDTQILQQSDTLLIQQQDEQAIIYQQSQDFVQSPPQLNEQNDISLGNPLDSRSSSSSIKSLKKQKQVASNSTENKVYGSNTILPAISQNASMNIDLKKSSQQSKDKHIMQLQEKVNQLFEENEKLKNDQLQGFCQFDDSPVKTTKQYEDLQKEIQQLKLEKEQIILQHIQDQNLADLINESPLKIPKDDKEIIQDLKDKVIGLELEAQLVEFEKEGYLKDNLALRQEIQSLRLQVEYLTKSIKIQKETNIVLHNQKEGVFEQYIPPIHKCKGDNMINILERALNNDIEWSMYTSFTGLEDQQLERFKLLCNQLYQIAQLKGEAESLKKQLDQELFSKQRLAGEIKALVQEKKVLSQQCIDMQNEFDATSHRIKMSEPNSALKIDRSMDIDEGSANVRQLVGRQKRELESYKQENMMLKNIVRSHEEDEQRFCDQNKIVKDENKSLCAEIVQLKEDRNKLIEKLSNNQDGALTEHVISVLDKFFNAYLQENKQELKVYYQSLMSLIGKPQQEELILKLLSSIEKKKPSGLFKYF